MDHKINEVIAPQYMAQFQCIGSECEDSCCTDEWKIYVDKVHYKKIEKAFSNNHRPREEFTKQFKRIRGPQANDFQYAEIMHSNGARCGLLKDDGTCELHSQYGSKILPDVCATYPRLNNVFLNRLERYGSLSCPEIARLCLLHKDSLKLGPLEITDFRPRAISKNLIKIEDNDFYALYLDEIRQTIIKLLSLPKYTFEQRMFFVIFFIVQINDFFYQGITDNPKEQLREAIQYINNEESLAEIVSLIPGIAIKLSQPVQLITKLLTAGLATSSPSTKHFSYVVMKYGLLDGITEENKVELLSKSLDQYSEVKKSVSRIYSDRIDSYLTNYAMNYWLGNWYTDSPNLIIHMRKLLLRMAALKYIFFNHPNIVDLKPIEEDDAQQNILDQTIVEVVYLLGRRFEHNQTRIDKMEEEMDKLDYGLPVLASLLKF